MIYHDITCRQGDEARPHPRESTGKVGKRSITCAQQHEERVEKTVKQHHRRSNSQSYHNKRDFLTRHISSPCVLLLCQKSKRDLDSNSHSQTQHEGQVECKIREPCRRSSLRRQNSKRDFVSGSRTHQDNIEGKVREALRQSSLLKQLSSRDLVTEQSERPKTPPPKKLGRRRQLQKQASQLVLTTAEKKSLDDMFNEYDTIAAYESPLRRNRKLMISDLNLKSSKPGLRTSCTASSPRPQVTNLSSLTLPLQEMNAEENTFADLIDEYESIHETV